MRDYLRILTSHAPLQFSQLGMNLTHVPCSVMNLWRNTRKNIIKDRTIVANEPWRKGWFFDVRHVGLFIAPQKYVEPWQSVSNSITLENVNKNVPAGFFPKNLI